MHRRGLARLPARRARRARSTATAPMGPTSRSTATASTRTSCCSIPMRGAWPASCAGPTRCSATASNVAARRPVLRPPRQRAGACRRRVVVDDSFNWGDDRPPDVPWDRHGDLRGACARPDACCARTSAARARHLRRAGRSARHRPPATARRHRGRAAAGPRLRAGPLPASQKGLRNYWGYNTSASSRPSRATCPTARANEMRDRRAPPARRRHRGHPRRRLQPHRRGQRAGPDAVVPRPRQRQLLPAGRRRSAPLHQRHRQRQHAEPLAIRACCRW